MIAKVALIAALVAVARAGVVGYGGAGVVGYGGAGVVGYGAAPVVAKAIVEAPQPYDFGYSHHTDDGAATSRQETSDAGNAKTGSYSIQNPDGTYRHVEYIADAAGFRAVVKTNEHGTAPQNPAATQVLAQEPPYKVLPAPAPIVKAVATPVIAKAGLGYAGLGYGAGLGYAASSPVIAKAGLGYAGLGYGAGLGYAAAPALAGYGGLGLRAGYGGVIHG